MNDFNKYCLEFNNLVNNVDKKKLNSKYNHIINKDEYIKSFKSFKYDIDYVGFDLDSLDIYENWLGENIGRY